MRLEVPHQLSANSCDGYDANLLEEIVLHKNGSFIDGGTLCMTDLVEHKVGVSLVCFLHQLD